MNHHFNKHYTADVFRELCHRYGITPANTELIKEDSNLIYDCGDSILRVSYSAIRSAADMEVELDWLDFLYRKKVSVVNIIPSVSDNQMERIGEIKDHFTAVLFKKIQGRTISKETWNNAHFQKLGHLAGLIHRTNREYVRKEHLKYIHWDEMVECGYATLLPDDERELRLLNQQLISEFRSYPRSAQHYGLIHNDLHLENYLLTGPDNSIVLFDFEVACQSWYLYEIATALYYACLVNRNRNNQDFEQLFLKNFLVGYRAEYDLPPIDFEVVLKFMLYRDLYLYGYVLALWQHRRPPPATLNYLKLIDESIAVRRRRLEL